MIEAHAWFTGTAQRHTCSVHRFNRSNGITLNARYLNLAGNRVAGQTQVVFHTDFCRDAYLHWATAQQFSQTSRCHGAGDANFTLKMWPNVRRGEKLYISPYKENADLMFDSSLPDEVAVLKPFVVPLLEALPQGKYEIADDILRGFERIEIMEESNIAPSSLVREFIGGSIYPS